MDRLTAVSDLVELCTVVIESLFCIRKCNGLFRDSAGIEYLESLSTGGIDPCRAVFKCDLAILRGRSGCL